MFTFIFFIGVPLYLLFNLFIVPKLAKPFLSVLLFLAASANYMMMRYGVYIDRSMMRNAFETNTREAMDLITPSFVGIVFLTGILPAILLWMTKIEYSSFAKEAKRRSCRFLASLLILLIMIATSFKDYASFCRNNRSAIYGLMNVFNFTRASVSYIKHQRRAKRPFKILDAAPVKNKRKNTPTVFVLVLGETARAANFSLDGYARETNPLLTKQDIVYFKNVTSSGTSTAESVPCMFSVMTHAKHNTADEQRSQNLIDLLQTSGYNIVWKENDDGCKGVCTRVKNTENVVKTHNPKYCFDRYCLDGVFIEAFKRLLKNIKKDTVIVFHTMGSHGPSYYKRYPDEFKKFTPTCDTSDLSNCSVEQIVNTYDNTILYTDFVVSSLIDILKEYSGFESGLLYVSDHGESLGENNIYLHGLPYAVAPKEQKEIPMLVWLNQNMRRANSIDYEALKKQAATENYSHDNLFHSVLGLLNVSTTVYNADYDLFKSVKPSFEKDKAL